MSIGKISLEANMNEFADDQVTKTKIYIDKMNESSTMFPVIVTLNELPNQGRTVCINLKVRLFS